LGHFQTPNIGFSKVSQRADNISHLLSPIVLALDAQRNQKAPNVYVSSIKK
jgi:hypothetical protein